MLCELLKTFTGCGRSVLWLRPWSHLPCSSCITDLTRFRNLVHQRQFSTPFMARPKLALVAWQFRSWLVECSVRRRADHVFQGLIITAHTLRTGHVNYSIHRLFGELYTAYLTFGPMILHAFNTAASAVSVLLLSRPANDVVSIRTS